MEMKIDLNEFRKNKLFVATPMYGGQAHYIYIKSILDLNSKMNALGVECKFSFLSNESLITRARNYMVDEFLRTDYTHLLFIDSDVGFEADDILALIALDKDVIGGPYPKKSINWTNVHKAMQTLPIEQAGEAEKVAGNFVFNPVPGTTTFKIDEPVEVMEIGTGYMLIKRDVFVKFRQEYPHLNYRPDHLGQKHFDGSRMIHAFFDTVIDPESHRYLSEDYMFCQHWRAIGGKVWFCPWMRTTHSGTYSFQGDMPAIAQLTGNL